MKKYVLLSIVFALLILGSGCVQNPNSNLYYANCCQQNDNPDAYTCTAKMDGDGNYIKEGELVLLDGCGSCRYWNEGAGTVYGDDKNNPLLDDEGKLLTPRKCANNCNFQKANCTNTDSENTCYGIDPKGKQYSIGPICADASPNPCVQNHCSAMVCHEIEPKVRLTADKEGLDSEGQQGSPAGQDYIEDRSGLYGKACEFMQLDRVATTILKKEGTFINSFRLGIQGTFSDYDRARYYLPPSDFFCGNTQTDSIVDRFTKYLDGDQALSEFSENFKAKLHDCTYTGSDNDGYWSCSDPSLSSIKFSIQSYKSKESAEVACAKICSFSQIPACADNSDLLVTRAQISPPYSKNGDRYQPFVDVQKYYEQLDKAYPVPLDVDFVNDEQNPLDYYGTLPEITDSMTDEQKLEAAYELLKPGPAGGRVFECLDNSDCMSGTCDKSAFSRSACIDKNTGKTVPCGCRLVQNCQANFMCETYEGGTRREAICRMDKTECDWTAGEGNYKLICDYTPIENPQGNGVASAGAYSASVNSISKFGSDSADNKDAQGKRLEAEMVNIEKLSSRTRCYNENATDENDKWKDMTLACPTGCQPNPDSENENDACTCESGYSAKEGSCPDTNYKKERFYEWTDEIKGFTESGMLLGYYYSFSAAPDKQTVWGVWPEWGGLPSYIITGRHVNAANLMDASKFPLVSACDMTVSENENDNADMVRINSKNFNGTKEQALEIWGKIYADKEDYYWRWDSTWKIKSLGKCRLDTKGIPQVLTYGVCKPCGTMLSLAYQNVSDYVASDLAQYKYCNILDRSECKVEGYCPTACSESGLYCSCPQDKDSFISYISSSPKTDPEFSHLASKIAEYQSSDIIPILDLRDYSIRYTREGGEGATLYGMSENLCKKLGGKYFPETCLKKNRWTCLEWREQYCQKKVALQDDYLLTYLQNNRSAVILLLADVPSDCADTSNNSVTHDGKNCRDTIDKIHNASLICPNCMLALEYARTIEPPSADEYPADLKAALERFSGAGGVKQIAYDPQYFGPPKDSDGNLMLKGTLPEQIAEVDILFLKVDFGAVGHTLPISTWEERLEHTINISRKVLQHVGYNTIYKMNIPRTGANNGQLDGAYTEEELYHTLNDMQAQMAASGIVGMLLPPLDNGNPKADKYEFEEDTGRLVSGLKTAIGITDEDKPFCAAQAGSTSFLHPDVTVALQKSLSKEVCECRACSSLEISAGTCTQAQALCLDNSPCQIYDGKDSSGNAVYRAAVSGDSVKCEQGCFRAVREYQDGMSACANSNEQVTCRKVESSNDRPTVCNSATDISSGCDILTFRLSTLTTNAYLLPYQAELIAGLPVGKKCYISDPQASNRSSVATYDALLSTKTSSQTLIYPMYGATTTDCGIGEIDEDTIDLCQNSKVPLPVRKSVWICS